MNEAELVFSELMNCDRALLYLGSDLRPDKHKLTQAAGILKRRITGEPVQYILGETEFMGLKFKVNRHVFIPRPETEILVEAVIDLVTTSPRHHVTRILDIGTGSGNIAISLAKFIKNCKIVAVDISGQAIEVSKNNAGINGVGNKIHFIERDFFNLRPATCDLQSGSFDFIVSNPPYIPTDEIAKLQPEIGYEPSIALDGDIDGLDFYRRIISEAPHYLKESAALIMEMGFGQRAAIENIFKRGAKLKITRVLKDYNNIDRLIIAKLKG